MGIIHRTEPPAPAPEKTLSPERGLGLRWRIVIILLFVSILPLLVVGLGSGIVFGGMLEDKALQLQRSNVRSHASAIDLYLAERLRALDLVARTHSTDELTHPQRLHEVFDDLQASYGSTFLDLGVIDDKGRHLAYVGAYDLAKKNYAGTPWFSEVMANGSHVSDVFLGYRRVPHCVIAVKRNNGSTPWILRATIDGSRFESLVGAGNPEVVESAFIVNRQGLYQTTPPAGSVLQPAMPSPPEYHTGVRDRRVFVQNRQKIETTAWLNDRRWMLVVQQDEAAIREPVRRAIERGTIVTAFAVLVLVVTTFLATRHLTGQIDRANAQHENLSRELMRSAKLAVVGELATGLAHEINNPLAIISSERTNLSDQLELITLSASDKQELDESVERIRRQVSRCASITAKMLRFGRSGEGKPHLTNLGARVSEVAQLMERQAAVRNVKLCAVVREDLPEVFADPTELEQVLVNLINNAMYAMEKGGTIHIAAALEGGEVQLSVRDTGTGIPAENLERIFQPFFTTKPAGEGTGLGLSVCYGLVRGWGGTIRAESREGEGTTMTIHLPVPAIPDAPGPTCEA